MHSIPGSGDYGTHPVPPSSEYADCFSVMHTDKMTAYIVVIGPWDRMGLIWKSSRQNFVSG
jgi:hypothetical protein